MMRLFVVLVGFLVLSTPAFAQEKCKAGDNYGKSECRFDEGIALMRNGEFVKGEAKLREAYRLFPRADYIYSWAAALRKIKRYDESANRYQEYIDHPNARATSLARAKKALAELDKKLTILEIYCAGSGEVKVEGKKVGDAPLVGKRVRVVPKKLHTVAVTRTSGKIQTASASGEEGDVVPVKIEAIEEKVDCTLAKFSELPQCKAVTTNCTLAENKDKPECYDSINCELPENQKHAKCDCSLPANAEKDKCRPPEPGNFGIFYRSDILLTAAGHTFAPGFSYAINDDMTIFANVLYGRFSSGENKFGGELGLRWAFLSGDLRPYVGLSVPVISFEGISVQGRGAVGGIYQISSAMYFFGEIGMAYAITLPDDAIVGGGASLSKTSLLGSLGLEVRL